MARRVISSAYATARGHRLDRPHHAGAQGKISHAHLLDSEEKDPTPAMPTSFSVDYNMYVVGTDRVDTYTTKVEINGASL